jgi:pyridine nucleotide-disulfide oxidoreductase
MSEIDIAIIGAGPYGLAAAAHLRRAGAEVAVLGDPMSFWRGMPKGMLLRSNWTATCIGEYEGPLSLDSYRAATGAKFDKPVPLERFIDYGTWVAGQVAPDADRRTVERLEADGAGFRLQLAGGAQGEHEAELRARRVVVAAGIAPFANLPPAADGLPPELVSHSSEHQDLSRFSGRRVLVVGGGQSALESAALLHEGGAQVEVIARADHLNWLHGGKYHRLLGRFAPLFYAPTDVGPLGLSRLVAVPGAFTALPRRLQEPLAYRSIRPAAATWLDPRLRDVPITLSRSVASLTPQAGELLVTLSNGDQRTVDHLLLGTGYRVDIARYPFLAPALLDRIKRVSGYPVLGPGMQSSVPGLHFLGAPAAWSFGPTMRFVSGGWYTASALTKVVTGAAHGTGKPGSRPAARPPVSTASDNR